MTVKNHVGSEVLYYLQAKKLAGHSFMDVSRNMRRLDQTQRTLLLTEKAVARILYSFALAPHVPKSPSVGREGDALRNGWV